MRKNHLFILAVICIAALILRIIMIRIPLSQWWDPAIYVGMAKYLFSGGVMGMWEVLRPPLWPIILGTAWIAGLNPLITAQWLATLSGIFTIILIYVIGEKIEKGMGLASALILALSPVYTFFVAIPTNDIPSAFVALIAAYLLLEKRWFWAGFVTAVAFLFRFPHGLFLVPFGLYILIESWNTVGKEKFISDSFKKIGALALGFALLAVPYLFVNDYFFGDALLPLKEGRSVINGITPKPWYSYVPYLFKDNPLIILSIIGIGAYIFKLIRIKKVPATALTLSLLCIAVIGGYMSHLGHKELRYTFGFLPFLILTAAYGARMLWDVTPTRYAKHIVMVGIAAVGIANFWHQAKPQYITRLSPERASYYNLLPPGTNTITSSPQIMLYSDTRITGVFSTWEAGMKMLEDQRDTLTYVAVDTNQMFCPGKPATCEIAKAQFLDALDVPQTIIYKAFEGQVELAIYKLK